MTAVRWGVLTTARIAQDRFLPAMKKARNAVASAVSSPNGGSAEIADRFGVPASYRSHEERAAANQGRASSSGDLRGCTTNFSFTLDGEFGRRVLSELDIVNMW